MYSSNGHKPIGLHSVQDDVRISSNAPLLLKGIEPSSNEPDRVPNGEEGMHQPAGETRTTSLSCAFLRSPRYYLRASNPARTSRDDTQTGGRRVHQPPGEPGGLIVVRTQPNGPLPLKAVEPESPKATGSTSGWEASISGVGCTEPPHVVRIPSEEWVT
jgi:hypothetical protein